MSADRLLAIIGAGDAPDAGERARLYQAISESEPHLLFDLAEEAGLTMDGLEERIVSLLGASVKSINPWLSGERF